jgi:hypothetical protein
VSVLDKIIIGYIFLFISSHLEGRLAIVTNAGRDAVDAAASGRNEGRRARARSEDAFLLGGAFELRTPRERAEVRRTTTLRDADRGGDAPHLHRLARRPKLCGPCRNPACSFRAPTGSQKVPRRRRRQVSTVAGESTKQAEKPLCAERRMCPVLSWWLTRALVFIAHEAADAPCVRRSARPLLGARTKAVSGAPAPFKEQGSPRMSATRCALFLARMEGHRALTFGRGANGASAARAVVNHRVAIVML